MKFERINDKKSKITYTIKELEVRNIDPKKLITNSEEAQDLILDMVESLEDRFDYDISSARLMIEASSTPENDFVVTITNIDDEEKASGSMVSKKLLKLKQQKTELEKNTENNIIVKFETLDDLIDFARSIYGRINVKSEMYKIKSEYYLNIMPYKNHYLDRTMLLRLSSDFGIYVSNASVFEGYLKEHATLVLGRQAIKRLAFEF